jgi:1-acyl-sn-glycerol-3-phosphate acyltransferase
LSLLRSVCAWLFTALYWTSVVIILIITFRRLPDEWTSNIIRFWGKTVLRILSIDLVLLNENPFIHRKPRVVICNHQSALDLAWGAAICPPSPLVIGKKEIILVPFLNLAWWAFEFIRIDRKNPSRAIKSLEGVSMLLTRDSRSLFIAPEGTRTVDGRIAAFKKGAFHIAIQAQIPIYPILVEGAFEAMPKKSWIAKSGSIRLLFLPPIETQGKTIHDVSDFTESTRAQMISDFEKMK